MAFALYLLVGLERLADEFQHGHARIERGVGVLEDHLRTAAKAAGAQFPVGGLADVDLVTVEIVQDLPLGDGEARRMDLPIVLLPQPDSPTMPNVSPS